MLARVGDAVGNACPRKALFAEVAEEHTALLDVAPFPRQCGEVRCPALSTGGSVTSVPPLPSLAMWNCPVTY